MSEPIEHTDSAWSEPGRLPGCFGLYTERRFLLKNCDLIDKELQVLNIAVLVCIDKPLSMLALEAPTISQNDWL